jgi:hypothetical protein
VVEIIFPGIQTRDLEYRSTKSLANQNTVAAKDSGKE